MKQFLLIFTIVPCLAQSPAPPAFEAATVKPSVDEPGHSGSHSRRGMLVMQGQTLHSLVRSAYHLTPNQVEGGPRWTESERYDINAKSEGPADDPELMRMLQTLLAERFKLKFHIDKKEFSGYVLVAAKGGLKIKPVGAETNRTHSNSNGLVSSIEVEGSTLKTLADVLSRSLRMPVGDASGIDGAFTFKLEWTPEDLAGARADSGVAGPPTIFTALQEQLGLKLESRKVPMDVYVIDSAEKPGEN